eukprot:scaffold20722_cov33-Tisochrysis_lutea.AAC.4
MGVAFAMAAEMRSGAFGDIPGLAHVISSLRVSLCESGGAVVSRGGGWPRFVRGGAKPEGTWPSSRWRLRT